MKIIKTSESTWKNALLIYSLGAYHRSRDSVVGIATSYLLDDRGVGVRVQTVSEVHPTSYPMGTGGSFPVGKAAGAVYSLHVNGTCGMFPQVCFEMFKVV
jgi:hypothetical protein